MNLTQPITLTLAPNGDGGGWKLDVAQPQPQQEDDLAPPLKYEARRRPDGMWEAVALRSVYNSSGDRVVRKGAVSGALHSATDALSQKGSSWVEPGAQVRDRAYVYGDARVTGHAVVEGTARVFGSALLSGSARVSNNACVYGEARVFGSARVFGTAQVMGTASVQDSASVSGDIYLHDGQFYDRVKFDVRNEYAVNVFGGCWNNNMYVTGPTDFLQIHTRWGAMTVAHTDNNGWTGTVGCQRFENFGRLIRMANDFSDTTFEKELLVGWFQMLKVSLRKWGVSKEAIARTTVLPADWNNDDEDED